MKPSFTLADIAQALGARLVGDPAKSVQSLQTLAKATSHDISFLANTKYRHDMSTTQAGAVLLSEADLEGCPVDALVLDNPYLGYARLSHWFDSRPQQRAGIHPAAIIDATAQVDPSANVAAFVVIEAWVVIDADVSIGVHTFIGTGSHIGSGSRVDANVSVYHQVDIGKRAIIHSGAVIGSDGFGFANDRGRWNKIAQLGRVIIGDDVEVGAGTSIDRGALGNTVIGNGVKLDNQIQIAHNVEIGDDSAFAGCVGVAGSSKIGRRCTLAGGVGLTGHLELGDDVHISSMGLVTKSLPTPGVYSSGTGLMPNQQWKRNVVRFRQLDQLADRVKVLEKTLQSVAEQPFSTKPKG